MTNATQIGLLSAGLIVILLTIARLGLHNAKAQRLAQKPIIFVLSLGITTGGLSLYSAFLYSAATPHGVFYLFFGIALMFLCYGVFLKPLFDQVSKYQFQNIADLLAFRFRHSGIGPSVSLLVTITIIPLIATQLYSLTSIFNQALEQTADSKASWGMSALLFIPVLFSIFILRSQQIERRERNNDVVLIAAFDTVLRLLMLYVLGYVALRIFGDLGALQTWLKDSSSHYEITSELNFNSRSLMVSAFVGTICLPHLFQIIMVEKPSPKARSLVIWLLPILLIIFALPFTAIVSALKLIDGQPEAHDYLIKLAVITKDSALSNLIILAALSSFFCNAIIILGSCSNHIVHYWVLPTQETVGDTTKLYRWLRRSRRFVSLIMALFVWVLANTLSGENALFLLSDVCIGVLAQLFPGLICCIYFPRISSKGFFAGTTTGVAVVLLSYIVPELFSHTENGFLLDIQQNALITGLVCNALCAYVVSRFNPSNEKEFSTAKRLMNRDNTNFDKPNENNYTVQDFITALVPIVGVQDAERYVTEGLEELQINHNETRPYILIQLHDVVERNLSKTLGSSVAQNAMNQLMPYSLSRIQGVNVVDAESDQINTGFIGIAGELDKLRRFHRNTLARLPVGVCYINSNREILLWNRSLAIISGLSARHTEGKQLHQLPAPWFEILRDFISNDVVTQKMAIDAKGRQRWIRLHKEERQLRPEKNADNVLAIEDITDIKSLEDDLIHNERLASVGRLAAGVAHEIGNPITGIACLAQNIKLDSEEEEVLETANEIITQTQRVSTIMQSLVGFSHAGGAEIEHNRMECNISDCAKDAIRLLSLDRMATAVDYEFSGDDTAIVNGDPQRLQQVFVNLLSNARDASEEKSKILVEVTDNSSKVSISVTDQGSGIPPAVIENIFEPFFTTKAVGKGTGLGLALVFGIIEEHEGSIKANSPVENGRGTQFTIELPK